MVEIFHNILAHNTCIIIQYIYIGIYYDTQKFRGITPKSLKITQKMRSISYSPNHSHAHTRRNTINTVSQAPTYSATPVTLSKRIGDLYGAAQSVPNVIKVPMTSMAMVTTISTDHASSDQSSIPPNETRLISNMSIDTNATTTDIEEDISQDSNTSYIGHITYPPRRYTDSMETENISKLSSKLKPNVQNINMRDPITITVPEDAVLTPKKESEEKTNTLDIDNKKKEKNKDEYLDHPISNNNSSESLTDINDLETANSNLSVYSNVSLQSNESEKALSHHLKLQHVQSDSK